MASEISAITEKASPVNADMLIIEDSADSNNKKMVQAGNLPGGTSFSIDNGTVTTATHQDAYDVSGATDWFIRWPFIIEGMIIGLVGALTAGLLLFGGYNVVFNMIASKMLFVELVPASYVLSTLLWQFSLAGLISGGIASFIALRKFLVV